MASCAHRIVRVGSRAISTVDAAVTLAVGIRQNQVNWERHVENAVLGNGNTSKRWKERDKAEIDTLLGCGFCATEQRCNSHHLPLPPSPAVMSWTSLQLI